MDTQRIETAYFGEVTYCEPGVIHFENGLPGFEQERGFVTIRQEGCDPLVFLQSVSKPSLCFVTLPVQTITPDYRFELQPEDLEALGLPADSRPESGRDLVLLAVVSVNDSAAPTANLLAPVVIHPGNRRGVQVIQAESGHALRHPLECHVDHGATCS